MYGLDMNLLLLICKRGSTVAEEILEGGYYMEEGRDLLGTNGTPRLTAQKEKYELSIPRFICMYGPTTSLKLSEGARGSS